MLNNTQNPYCCLASSTYYDKMERFVASQSVYNSLRLQCTHLNALFARVFVRLSFETVVPELFNIIYHISVLSLCSIWSEVFSVMCL